jgi:hypothetical protein
MPDRRDALIAAVAAHNRSHKPLPPSAGRLLEAMFPAESDVCQQSLEALEGRTGLGTQRLQKVLAALLAAGIIVREATGGGRRTNRYRLLLPAGGAQ